MAAFVATCPPSADGGHYDLVTGEGSGPEVRRNAGGVGSQRGPYLVLFKERPFYWLLAVPPVRALLSRNFMAFVGALSTHCDRAWQCVGSSFAHRAVPWILGCAAGFSPFRGSRLSSKENSLSPFAANYQMPGLSPQRLRAKNPRVKSTIRLRYCQSNLEPCTQRARMLLASKPPVTAFYECS